MMRTSPTPPNTALWMSQFSIADERAHDYYHKNLASNATLRPPSGGGRPAGFVS